MAAKEYSRRLGSIDDGQFRSALERLGLGEFVRAGPVAGGLFGQNVLVASTTGEYVLRGAPHYGWQLPAERFFARLLHERTMAPVPWPYLLDPGDDVFGWSYAVMPRIPGLRLAEGLILPQAGLQASGRSARTDGGHQAATLGRGGSIFMNCAVRSTRSGGPPLLRCAMT